VIRPATDTDLDALLAIQRDTCVVAFAHVFPPELYPFPVEEVRRGWGEALADPEVETYVAELRGEPVGSVSIGVGTGFLRTLYVLPDVAGQGIGSVLHDRALARLREHDHATASLWTLGENWPARAFYEHRGWRLAAETRVVPFPPHPLDVRYVRDLRA
jgi:GNAT superfamily N-acetyltransferase